LFFSATKQKIRENRRVKGDREITGFEEMTVEEKRPREGRSARNLEAPEAVGWLESDGWEDEEPSMALDVKKDSSQNTITKARVNQVRVRLPVV
jgi:hypothetical protein